MRKFVAVTIKANVTHLGVAGAAYLEPREITISTDAILALKTRDANLWSITLKPEYVKSIILAIGLDERLPIEYITVKKSLISELL